MMALMPIFRKAFAITPSDTADLATDTRGGIWVGGAGAVHVITAEGDDVTISGIAAGQHLPVVAKAVRATGTTATLLTGLAKPDGA